MQSANLPSASNNPNNPAVPLSASMIHDLPIITQFEAHAAQSIIASNAPSLVSGERAKVTHASRRRRKTRAKSNREGGEESVFQPGNRLVDRYEVVNKIGQGGMSLVYEAFDEVRNEHVALKVLLPSLAASSRMQDRFLQEGRIASNFSHPHIARVFDLHQTESLFMLSMELLHGSTVRHDMERRKAQRQAYRPSEVLTTIQQVSMALEVVHTANVIHRDIKPENLWMGLDETVKIMDFGIARDASRVAHTTGPRGSGTPYYIAPEQLSASANLDHRADQYSLGVIAYEMLTGSIPQGAVHAPHEINPEVPRKLSMAIFRAINSDPAKRFSSVKAFAEAARFTTGTPWWVRAGMLAGGTGLIAGTAFGVQFGLMPLLENKPSPVWASVAPQSVKENETVSFVVRDTASTLTGSNLEFKLLSDAPAGAKIDASTGKFEWKPDETQGPKDYTFKIMAKVKQEGQALDVDEKLFSISVGEQFDAPKMETPDTFSVKEHDLLKVQLEAKDINVPAVGIRYELLEGPAGMSIDGRTGMLQWKPQENDGGTNVAPVVKVSLDHDDHLNASITRKLSVRVEESIDPPAFTSANRMQVKVGEATSFRFTARDPNTPEINRYFRLKNGDRFGMSVDPQSGELYWTPTEDQSGKEFEITAEIGWDGAGKSQSLAEQTIKVSVAELKNEKEEDKSKEEDNSNNNASNNVVTLPSPIPAPAPSTGVTCPNSGNGGGGNGQGSGGQKGGNGTCPNAGGNNGGQVGGQVGGSVGGQRPSVSGVTITLPGGIQIPIKGNSQNLGNNNPSLTQQVITRGIHHATNGNVQMQPARQTFPAKKPGFPPQNINNPNNSSNTRSQVENFMNQSIKNELMKFGRSR